MDENSVSKRQVSVLLKIGSRENQLGTNTTIRYNSPLVFHGLENPVLSELKTTTLAKSLNVEQLQRIADVCKRESLPAGTKLFDAKEVPGKLFIILKGCLKAYVERHGQTITKGFFNPGEVVGQYGLIFNEPNLADVVAEFDTTLLTIERPQFLRLMDEVPELLELLRQDFGKRIRSAIKGEKTHRFAPMIVCVHPDGLATNIPFDVAHELSIRGEQVAIIGSAPSDNASLQTSSIQHFAIEDKPEDYAWRELLDQGFDRLMFCLDGTQAPQLPRLLEQADEVLWFFSATNLGNLRAKINQIFETSPSEARKIRRVCLLENGDLWAPSGLPDDRLHRRDFIMPIQNSTDTKRLYRQGIQRITRHLCDVKIGLTLAGGGARGLVHFGVLRALDRADISFDFISGTSAGSMFGLSYATGLEVDYMLDAYHHSLTPGWPLSWLPNGDRWFLVWKYRTRGWDKMLRVHFNCDFEQLQTPFVSVSVDLVRGEQEVVENGDIIHAMLESLNLPFIANPILREGMALVDGGVLNNLPADVLLQRGADYVVGVNVSAGITEKFGVNTPGMKTSDMKQPKTLETLFRVLEVMGKGTADIQKSACNLLINPDTSAFSFTDFTQGRRLAEVGEAATDKLVPEIKANIAELMNFNRQKKLLGLPFSKPRCREHSNQTDPRPTEI